MAIKSEYLGGASDWENGEVLEAQDLLDTMKEAAIVSGPVGCVFAWLKTLTNTPSLPDNWVECNGQTISDADSVYNGVVIPNLNANRFLRGNSTSGGTGGSDTHTHTGSTGFNSNGTPGGDIAHTSQGRHTHSFTTDKGSTLPSYYEVVWIMRIK